MAEEEKTVSADISSGNCLQKTDDVFVNGESDDMDDNKDTDEDAQESLDNMALPEQIMPRKSSFMCKDGSRKPGQRKKTVSFSSMPTERKIATG
ncbi:hypothetical protein KUTeg_023464 [Tegillarca granosa]|uniref:Uncharacterized protein n=1 Tax=Tegillarca granosa TaxID=220873 RepID=A0ABQ9E1R2_TEGGR|nr:hypothetical protein KUTeg_023464 [Tegillarca granosa]